MGTQIGPDGWPAVFQDGRWHSRDGSSWWDGVAWVPTKKNSTTGGWLVRIGAAIVVVALLGYAVYTTVASNSEFVTGYYIGLALFAATLIVIYRFAGRWGWFGVVIRAGCFFLGALKVLTLVLHPPPV